MALFKPWGKITKKAVKVLKDLGFIGSSINPCPYMNKSAKGIVYVAFYIDDNLMTGNVATINNVIEALKSKRHCGRATGLFFQKNEMF